jgi:two-component system, OmpR family, sensor histidine kinase VanS
MAIVSIVLGWLVAGRVLRPLRKMTATAQRISERNLNERLALSGPDDELKDLADTIDGLLARLEAHVAQQQRFAANASHELRTPLALTQTLLDVARNDPNRDTDELVERLHAVNARAIELTETLLLLSRTDQRTFVREHIDLSLIAEEATETLLPLAEQRDVTLETRGDTALTIGSPALLLQMTTNLVHNAIVHNLPEHGIVSITASAHPGHVVLTVENTGEQLTPELAATLTEPFQRSSKRMRTDDAGVGLGLAIVKSIAQAHDGTLTLTPRAAGGLSVAAELPAAPALVADDRLGNSTTLRTE